MTQPVSAAQSLFGAFGVTLAQMPHAEYERVRQWLEDHGKDWRWLGAQCDLKRTQMSNWQARGIPAMRFAAIADAIGQSVDWIAGRTDTPAQNVAHLSPMALKLAAEFDKIADPSAQLDAFAEIIAVITRAAT